MTDHPNGLAAGGHEREDIELLLPWYVNGTLEPQDVAKVEAYLDKHPDMATQLATLREDMDETIHANEAIAGPSGAALDRLMTDIGQETPIRHRVAQARRGLMTMVDDFLHSLSPGRLGWTALAAAAVIMLQAGVVGTMMMNPPTGGGSTYQTASGGKALSGTFVLVQFKPGASVEKVSTFLTEQGAEIVAGPKPGGLYRVRVSTKKLDDKQRLAVIENLRSSETLINMVLPSQ
ncbi:MAG: hypothetical protein ACR2PI_13920 [Hyphomicrobiaceae bacterium]